MCSENAARGVIGAHPTKTPTIYSHYTHKYTHLHILYPLYTHKYTYIDVHTHEYTHHTQIYT